MVYCWQTSTPFSAFSYERCHSKSPPALLTSQQTILQCRELVMAIALISRCRQLTNNYRTIGGSQIQSCSYPQLSVNALHRGDSKPWNLGRASDYHAHRHTHTHTHHTHTYIHTTHTTHLCAFSPSSPSASSSSQELQSTAEEETHRMATEAYAKFYNYWIYNVQNKAYLSALFETQQSGLNTVPSLF